MAVAGSGRLADSHLCLRRYGHIAAKFLDKVILWGGQHHQSDEIWIYDIKRRKWGSRITDGDVPPRLSGSCCAMVGHRLYIFAGFTLEEKCHVNSIYFLNLASFAWTKVLPASGKPAPRDKFGCWVIDQKIVYFGGYGAPPSSDHVRGGKFIFHDELHGWYNDLISFDTSTNMWLALPHSDSHTPSPRAAHACTKVGNDEGYLFGGRSKDERLDDLYSLSFLTYTWCRIVTTGCVPEGRSWHSLIALDDTFLFLHGGFNMIAVTLSDSWLFNVKLNNWREIAVDKITQQRMWHMPCLGIDYGEVLVFGGCVHFHDLLVGMRIFHLSPLSLKRLALKTICKYPKLCGSWKDLPIQFISEIESNLNTE